MSSPRPAPRRPDLPRALKDPTDEPAWELFHENSKFTPHTGVPPDEAVYSVMAVLAEALSYDGYPVVSLPAPRHLPGVTLCDALAERQSALRFTPRVVAKDDLATLLSRSVGARESGKVAPHLRVFRAAPSAGALYPLELYVYPVSVAGIEPGLYHYHPIRHELRALSDLDLDTVSRPFAQPDLVRESAAILFITAVPSRSTFKYGERGYRFTLLEAGHAAQNLALLATALGLGCVCVGGFLDHDLDATLGLDGLVHSTVYTVLIGGRAE